MSAFEKPHRTRFEGDDYSAFMKSIFNRDGWKCRNPFCKGGGGLTVHHLKKRSQIGGDEKGNCITLCPRCHDDVEAHRTEIEVVDVVCKFREVEK